MTTDIGNTNGERRDSLKAAAHTARDEALATGLGFDAYAVHDWLKARASGRQTTKPMPVPWRNS